MEKCAVGDILYSLFTVFQEISLIHLEDVYLTGLCAEACKIARKHHSGFKPRGLDKKKFKLWVNYFLAAFDNAEFFHSVVPKA